MLFRLPPSTRGDCRATFSALFRTRKRPIHDTITNLRFHTTSQPTVARIRVNNARAPRSDLILIKYGARDIASRTFKKVTSKQNVSGTQILKIASGRAC